MQAAIIELADGAMTEKRVEIYMLERLEGEQKSLNLRLDNIDKSLKGLSREVSELKGSVRHPLKTPDWIKYGVYPLCVAAVLGMGAAVITLLVKVNAIETFVLDNGGFIAGLRLQKNANLADPKNIEETTHVLSQARAAKIKISADVIAATGKKFVDLSKNDPTAWNAALAFVNYRSFLNADEEPSLKNPDSSATTTSYYRINYLDSGGRLPAISAYGQAPSSQAARLNSIGSNFNKWRPLSKAFVVVEGGSGVVIDNMDMKNIVFRNTRIRYAGGPVIMENVYFVNCTFELVQRANGQLFADTLLSASPISFSAS